MAEKRYAVVTGGNRGIGFEICRQLASQGITVVLTGRDEKKGSEALERLTHSGLSGNLVFHQLDVMDSASIAILVEFIKTSFGKLDILVNNAGIGGLMLEGETLLVKEVIEGDAVRVSLPGYREQEVPERKASGILIETHESQEQCLETNYYGAKRMIEAFFPLMKLSPSPIIVNVSSFLGKLELLSNEWAKGVLSDAENLTEERVEEVLNQFLDDFKDKVRAKGWPTEFIAYKVSKSSLNAYTRIIAKKYPSFRINSVCPGYVQTDINANTGTLTAAEGAESVVKLALLPDDGPSGLFFFRKEVTTF